MPDETSTQRITRATTLAKTTMESKESKPRKSLQLSISDRRSIDGADVSVTIKSPPYLSNEVWRRIWWVVGI